MDITKEVKALVQREGGYDKVTDNPSDHGGLTRAGITQKTATALRYGDIRQFTHDQIDNFYITEFWSKPKFDQVQKLSDLIAAKLFDIKVNGGSGVQWMQRGLNILNRMQKDYPDIAPDGGIGPATLGALSSLLRVRGADGEKVLHFIICSLQGARFVAIEEADPTQEVFAFGWIRERAMFGLSQ